MFGAKLILPTMTPQPKQRSEPSALHEHAQENLRFIRAAMESATSFTGVSGLGYALAGATALPATWLAQQQGSNSAWLAVWMLELTFAALIAFSLTASKASKQGSSLLSASGKKLLLAFFPAMTVGGVLTLSFWFKDLVPLLPGVWLCLYGAAVMTAGAWSVRIIPVMGAVFLALGALTLLTPVSGNLMLALGFGGVHIVFGLIIWSKYGG